MLSKCKTRRERRDLKENKYESKWSSSFNLYEYAERRNKTENIKEDSELKEEKISAKIAEETYHSGKINILNKDFSSYFPDLWPILKVNYLKKTLLSKTNLWKNLPSTNSRSKLRRNSSVRQ